MKYAKQKPIGDFLVTVDVVRDGAQLTVDHKPGFYPHELIKFDADLFVIDEVSMRTGEAQSVRSFRNCTSFSVPVTLRPKTEYHLRITSPKVNGGIEPIVWQ